MGIIKIICEECKNIISEREGNWKHKDRVAKSICWRCNMNPSERKKFTDYVHNQAESWRSKKIKVIMEKSDPPSEMEMMMLKRWIK